MLYEDWRDAILEMCEKLPNRMCPFCEEVYEDDAEYVDVGVGSIQVTGNHCENPVCGAWELGAYACPEDHDYRFGWVRPKFSCPDDWKFTGHEWWCAAAGKQFWRKNLDDEPCSDAKLCICHTDKEKATAQAAGLITRENFDKIVGRIGTKYLDTDESIQPETPDFFDDLFLDED